METVGLLMKLLAKFFKENETERNLLNKNYKRFVRLIQSLYNHFKKNDFTWETLHSFDAKYSKNKAVYGQETVITLTKETIEQLKIIIEDVKDLKVLLAESPERELEVRVAEFISESAQSVLDGTFCKDQLELLEKLQAIHEMA